jgi:hypothetical protein
MTGKRRKTSKKSRKTKKPKKEEKKEEKKPETKQELLPTEQLYDVVTGKPIKVVGPLQSGKMVDVITGKPIEIHVDDELVIVDDSDSETERKRKNQLIVKGKACPYCSEVLENGNRLEICQECKDTICTLCGKPCDRPNCQSWNCDDCCKNEDSDDSESEDVCAACKRKDETDITFKEKMDTLKEDDQLFVQKCLQMKKKCAIAEKFLMSEVKFQEVIDTINSIENEDWNKKFEKNATPIKPIEGFIHMLPKQSLSEMKNTPRVDFVYMNPDKQKVEIKDCPRLDNIEMQAKMLKKEIQEGQKELKETGDDIRKSLESLKRVVFKNKDKEDADKSAMSKEIKEVVDRKF